MAPLIHHFFQFVDSFGSSIYEKEVFLEDLLKLRLYCDRKSICSKLFVEYLFRPFQGAATPEEEKSTENFFLVV